MVSDVKPLSCSQPDIYGGGQSLYLTVDVEEYYHAEVFTGIIDRAEKGRELPRVERNTMELIRLFSECNVLGTFFILGTLAKKHPGMIRAILESGHEIASHGNEHRMLTKMSSSEFREDIRVSKHILEDISGSAVLGYRAPTFSIVKKTDWAHEILREEGFRYSSSVFPVRHDRYGWPEFGTCPRKMAVQGDRWIWEVPLSVVRLGVINVPFGGGGYLRLYPLYLTRWFFRRLTRAGRPVIVYIHPWEIDRHHPQISMPVFKRIRHYAGISRTEQKMQNLLRSYPFQRMDHFLKSVQTAS